MTRFRWMSSRRHRARQWLAVLALSVILAGWTAPAPTTAADRLPDLGPAHVAPPPWPQDTSDLTADPAITFGRLDNGFRYVLMENRRPKDRVSVHLAVAAGSMNETEAQQGVAHFLEHMMFNGSTHFPPGALVRYFQSIGMQFGNDANARTGFDETVYDLILPTGTEDDLAKGLRVMHDYATGALLLEEEVARESGVILSEMRARDSAAYRTLVATLRFELPDFLASRRMPIGKAAVIGNADRALLKDFYDAWYRPENMVLVMVGDVSIPMAQRLIGDRFADFTPRAPAPAPPFLGTIDHRGLRVFHHHEPEAGGTTVSIESVRAHLPVADSLAIRRREWVAEMADRIVQYRLDARLKTPDAPFTAAAAGSGVYLNRVRYAEISADCSAENWRPTLTLLEQTLRQARLFGFSAAELSRAKKEVLKQLDNAVKEAPTRNSTPLARAIIRSLAENRVVRSPAQEKNDLAPLIEAVTLEEVQRIFTENWPDDHRLILVTGNADPRPPAARTPADAIRDVYLAAAGTVVRRPVLEAAGAFPYLPEPAAVGAIAFREVVDDLGITRIRLDNGIWINLKPTDFKTNEVLANLTFGHGVSAEPAHRPGLSLLAEATVDESGLGGMDTAELERALAGTSTTLNFEIAETHFNYAARSVSGEAALLFQLLYAHLTDPAFRDEALKLARERLLQDYQAFSRSVEGMMRIQGMRILAGGDTRFGMPSLEALQAVRLTDVRDWIAPLLASAPLELSIVGDFDPDEVIALARRYLGSLPRREEGTVATRTDRPTVPGGTVSRIDVETQIPKAMVVSAWQTADFWDIHRTRRLSVLADVFSERLRERIRETLGASYSPYAFNRASRAYDGYGVLQATVNVAPDQTDRVLEEVRRIAADLSRNGVTEDERLRAVDPILTSIKAYRQTNGYWLGSVLTGSCRAPQQLDWARSFMADYASVTTEELAALATAYLTDARAAAIIIRPKAAPDQG